MSFLKKISLLQVGLGMDCMKLFVRKVVDSKTRGSCIPTDSVKSGDDYPILIHNTGIGACIDSDKTNLAYLVGQSYKCQVGNIRIERGWGEI